MVKVKLTHQNAQKPKRSNPTDAGADLFATEDVVVKAETSEFMDFGVQMELPEGTCGLIFARSGLGGRGIRPKNCVGVIDEKYRGNLGMMVENAFTEDYQILTGDRIAQLVIMPVFTPSFELADELDMEEDRMGGFGSSGK